MCLTCIFNSNFAVIGSVLNYASSLNYGILNLRTCCITVILLKGNSTLMEYNFAVKLIHQMVNCYFLLQTIAIHPYCLNVPRSLRQLAIAQLEVYFSFKAVLITWYPAAFEAFSEIVCVTFFLALKESDQPKKTQLLYSISNTGLELRFYHS